MQSQKKGDPVLCGKHPTGGLDAARRPRGDKNLEDGVEEVGRAQRWVARL